MFSFLYLRLCIEDHGLHTRKSGKRVTGNYIYPQILRVGYPEVPQVIERGHPKCIVSFFISRTKATTFLKMRFTQNKLSYMVDWPTGHLLWRD